MAASLTVINYASAPITDFKNALNAKNLITEIKYEDNDCLIFTTPLLPDNKVLKVKLAASVYIMYFGDAWISAETITNPVQFSNRGDGGAINLYCIADDSWFFMAWEGTTQYYYGYVGCLNNGDVIAAGFTHSTNINAGAYNCSWNVTKNTAIVPISISAPTTFVNDNEKLLKMPLMWCDPGSKKLMMTGNEPAKTIGVQASSWVPGVNVAELGDSYYLTGSTGYTKVGAVPHTAFGGGLLVEFAPEP